MNKHEKDFVTRTSQPTKPRVLLLTTSFPVEPDSSSGIFVARLAEQLGQIYHLQVLAPDATRLRRPNTASAIYDLTTFRYAPKSWQILAHRPGGIPAALDSRKPVRLLIPIFLGAMFFSCLWHARKADLIFANWSVCGLVASLVGKLLGCPVITTIRGEDGNRAVRSRLFRTILHLCLKFSSKVITVSDDIAKNLRLLFPSFSDKIVMIPNGVELPPILSHHTEETQVRLLAIGNLTTNKSVHTLLQALSKLPSTFSLTIIGDGPEKLHLESLSKELGQETRISFLGRLPPEAIPVLLTKGDALVLCSQREGRPNVVLEAMAAGLPVLGTDIPGIRELVKHGETGFLFPVGDADALANQLLEIGNPQLRQQLGKQGRCFIERAQLSWEHSATLYSRVFNELISPGTTCVE